MNAGTDLARDIQTGFLNRLSLTSMRGVALIAGQLARRRRPRPRSRRPSTSSSAWSSASTSPPGALGILALFGFAAVISISFGALGVFLALRTGSGEAIQGLFPLLFVFLFLSSMNTPRDLIERRLVPLRRDREPGLVPDRVRPEPDHHRLGRRGARARLRLRRPDRDRARRRSRRSSLKQRLART